jgi:hypothetical protein
MFMCCVLFSHELTGVELLLYVLFSHVLSLWC